MNLLSEGGNVFKDSDGVPVTQRINREDVKPTLAWLERLLPGLDLQNNTLGSTGIKDTSGDLDIAVDTNRVTKQQLETQLARWVTAQGQDPKDWVRKSGTAVHFKTPIAGNVRNGFVQTDFMLLNNVPWSKFVLGAMPPDSQYKGRERNVMMNSIAKSLGYKLNQVAGIADRATNQIISDDPDQVARLLLNPRATRQDLASVESIVRALAMDPKRDAKLADFREHMARENLPFTESVALYRPVDEVGFLARLRDRIVNQGMQPLIEDHDQHVQHLREAKNPRIPYVEDLVFQAGLRGARQAVDIVKQAADNAQEYVTIKWDGCIHPDLKIRTNKGVFRIEEVIDRYLSGENFKVFAYDLETETDVLTNINHAVKKFGNKYWVEIEMENGEILRMTSDHKVFTTNRGWVQAQNLTDSDDIKISNNN
jgi:hypothetical protein